MMAILSDYGGYAHGAAAHTTRRGLDNAATASMRCLDCDKLNYVPRRVLFRAASPRCKGCGGPMEEIDPSRKRNGLESTKKTKKALATKRAPARRCPSCGVLMTSNEALSGHVVANKECLAYHVDERKCVPFGGESSHWIIPGTVVVSRENYGSKPWWILGVDARGIVVCCGQFRTKTLAEQEVMDHLGPVEFAR